MPDNAQFKEIAVSICCELGLTMPSFIGAGAFKETYFTTDMEGQQFALKVFNPKKCNRSRADREIQAVQQCNSPFIGKLHNWGEHQTVANNVFLYVMEEYLGGGNLTYRLEMEKGSIDVVKSYGPALINAVDHLRQKKLVHRDIKPDNIMFRSSSSSPVLVDFGLVRDLSEASLTFSHLPRGPGTPLFASPEQLNNEKELIDWRSDQFGVGVVLGMCLTGLHPYQDPGHNNIEVVDRVYDRAGISSSFLKSMGECRCEFLARMVAPWPVERFNNPQEVIKEIEECGKG